MLTVVIVKNPFNIQERNVYFPEYIEGRSVLDYCNEYTKSITKLHFQDKLIYSLNGKKVDPDVKPKDGDYIALCPSFGKKGLFGSILGAIAMIGLSLIAPHLGAVGASMMGFTGTAAVVAKGLLTIGILLIGGMVINALFPMKADRSMDDSSSASTYSWNRVSSNMAQGGALAVTYGTYLTAGTIIYRHVHIIDDEEYLFIVLCGGQGPIDTISDIRVNDMPITNYDGVEWTCRDGSNYQDEISFLDGRVFADQVLNYELRWGNESTGDPGWCYATTEGDCGTEVEVTINFPQGLYRMSDEGDIEETFVDIEIQGRVNIRGNNVREYDDSEWLLLGQFSIQEAKQSAFSRSYIFGSYAPDRFDVRVRIIRIESTGPRYANKVMWTMLSHSLQGGFVRPGKVLTALKIKATNQLSNDVRVDWLQTRNNVYVWDPNENQYVAKDATNPAWVCYDMIHRARPIKMAGDNPPISFVVDGIPAKYIDYDAFNDWAFHCSPMDLTGDDEIIYQHGSEGNKGGWGLSFNYIFANSQDLWEALKYPEAVGLGKVVVRGTKISCIFDKYWEKATQLFTVANINEGSFKVEYLPLLDRANAIEVSYINKEKRYQKDTVAVYESTYNTEGIIKNPTQLSLDGCVSQEQALRYAQYHLNHNNYQTRTCTIDVDIDSLACTIGDLILIQHDLPIWGYGGVITDYDEDSSKVVLDQYITFEANEEYQILCRVTDASSQDSATAETLEYRDIVSYEESPTTNTIYLSDSFDYEPQYGDVYAISKKNKVAKPFIIISIDRKSDLQATLTCIEYEPNAMNQAMQPVEKINYSLLSKNKIAGD